MLSQVNSNQKGEDNFCIFLTRLIALVRVLCVAVRGGHPLNAMPGLGWSHRNTVGALDVSLPWGLNRHRPRGHPPKVGSYLSRVATQHLPQNRIRSPICPCWGDEP